MTGKWLVPILLIAFASTAEAGVIVQSHFLRFGEPSSTEAGGMLPCLDGHGSEADTRNWGQDQTSDHPSWSVEGHPGFGGGPFAALLDTVFFCRLSLAGRLDLLDGRRPPLPELDGLIKPPQTRFCVL